MRQSALLLFLGLLGVTMGAEVHIQKHDPQKECAYIPPDEFPEAMSDMLDVVKTVPFGTLTLHPDDAFRRRWEAILRREQAFIVGSLEDLEGTDGKKFREDTWSRGQDMGGGWSRVIQDGRVLEKGGVNLSIVYGNLTKAAVNAMKSGHGGKRLIPDHHNDDDPLNFYAAGVSLVIHPHHPRAPTVHMNYRMFQAFDSKTGKSLSWWFGGGADLTPSFVYEEDAKHFHKVMKDTCDRHHPSFYPRFKRWCDEYFWIPHRQEARGIGGIFFDDLNEGGDPEKLMKFAEEGLHAFVEAYVPLVKKRIAEDWIPAEREWQQIRRGRYVEFNVMIDRGTKFGLATPGSRVESILMTLPLTARWEYDHHPPTGSWAEKSLDVFKHPRDWLPIDHALAVMTAN